MPPRSIDGSEDGPGIIVVVVTLGGYVDQTNAGRLRSELARASTSIPRIVVDLSTIIYMSSAGWSVLAQTATKLRPRGGDVVVCAMSSSAAQACHQLQFDGLQRSTLHCSCK